MFRSLAKRLFSTSNAPRDMYDRHAITVCSIIAYTTCLSVAHRIETAEQHKELLREVREIKEVKEVKEVQTPSI